MPLVRVNPNSNKMNAYDVILTFCDIYSSFSNDDCLNFKTISNGENEMGIIQ